MRPTKPCSDPGNSSLSESQKVLARDVLENLTGKWSIWVLHSLGEVDGPLRFSRLRESVHGITQKVLTRTLRQLERDGFVARTVFAEVPPRVEYVLTSLGRDLLAQIAPLFTWIVSEVRSFETARSRYTEKKK